MPTTTPADSSEMPDTNLDSGLEAAIAVVGMGVRFPDATTPAAFWTNVRDGFESVRFFTDEEMRARGVPEELVTHPDFVKAGMVLDGFDTWDAPFFGFNPRDAEIMDPQQRVFMECAWEALEHGGFDPSRFGGSIGVFAGSGMTAYMMYNLVPNTELMDSAGLFLVRHTGNDKDFLATRVSYTFDLKGPSLNIQTACSTSLVAVHVAAQSLLSGECDLALAGGVTIELPHGVGYQYQDGEILSPDGHCRAFDVDSKGTVFGSGAGVVLLRRLSDAMADGDHIHAIIRGSAVNNDGSGKIGYLAPSVDGQAKAVAEAMAVAGVEPDSVTYIETHGTGTPVGDPIEVAALTQAFRAGTDATGFCALASVKSNIGHTDTAAGVAGFIKAVLALEHRQIPPSLHYTAPNPSIDFASSPFYVNAELRDWESSGPRRAGVNSLGVGGTNAHVILEEAPAAPAPEPSREHKLLVLSARTPTALDTATSNLADHLRETDADLADVAYTLQTGRRAFAERRALVCRNAEEAADTLDTPGAAAVVTGTAADQAPSLGFMFAGGGSQYPGMGAGLYESEPVFRDAVDECLAHVQSQLDTDLRPLLFPDSDTDLDGARAALERPSLALPALFTMQYAQAQLWRSWGIEPDAMIGHSMGEYTAACLAGVFSVQDALSIVAMRGRLFETLPEGGMLSVPLAPDQLQPHLTPELSIAAVNGPELCVASGPNEALARLQERLAAADVECRRVHISVAAHSAMLEPILQPFGEFLRGIRFSAPQLPVASNLTGRWLSAEEATDPDYWVRHLRRTVQFSEGLALLLEEPNRVLVEVGAGRTLATLGRIHPARSATQHVFSSIRHPDETTHDQAFMLNVLGQLWVSGVDVDWLALYGDERRGKVALPTYPFERRRHWIEAPAAGAKLAADPGARRSDVGDWFSEVTWRRSPLRLSAAAGGSVLLFADRGGAGAQVAEQLRALGVDVESVAAGDAYGCDAGGRFIRADEPGDYVRLIRELAAAGPLPKRVLHMWSVDGATDADTACERGFYSLLHLAQALGEADVSDARIIIVTAGAQDVGGEGVAAPARAVVLGPARVIPKEYPGITCRTVDVDRAHGAATADPRLAARLLAEFDDAAVDDLVAYRGTQRFAQGVEPVQLPAAADVPAALRREGVYLITGGLGGMALELARDLVRRVDARLVLVARSALPPEAEWDGILEGSAESTVGARVRAVRELRAMGAEVIVVAADVTDREEMRAAVAQGEAHFGTIHGVIHAAGVLDDGLIQLRTREQAARVLAPKIAGTLLLDELFHGHDLDFMVLFSSVSAFAGLAGQVDYTAASAFLDAFAHHRTARDGSTTLSVGWSAWRDVGMTAELARATGASGDETLDVRHPLLHGGALRPDGEEVYTAELSPAQHWVLGEHRIRGGQSLIPGTGYLELARAALEVRAEPGDVELRDVFFMSPFVVADGESRQLRLELSRGNGGDFVVLGQVGSDGDWEEHVRGSVARVPAAAPVRHDVAALLGRCTPAHVGAAGGGQYLQFGPRWSNVAAMHYGRDEAVAELRLPPEYQSDLTGFGIHPALLDMATAGAQALIGEEEADGHFFVPIGYGIVRLRRRMPGHVFSHIRYRPTEGARHDVAIFDVTLVDSEGVEIAEITDFTMKRVTAAALQHADGSISTVRRDAGPAAGLLVELEEATTPAEGADAFARLLDAGPRPHVIVSPKDARGQLAEWRRAVAAGVRQPDRGRAPAEDPQLRADLLRMKEVLEQVDAVTEALAIAKAGRGGERRLLAYVVFAPGESATVSELRRHAKKNLPAHLVPGNFIEMDGFPRMAAGEIDTGALPDPFGPVDDHVAPRTEMEKRIAALWRDVIGVDPIGVHDNFFDIGGHSLLAVRVITRIDREIGVRLDQAVMVLQTLEQIAARCERDAPARAEPALAAATN
jgi:acyl transferase domain-containing protein